MSIFDDGKASVKVVQAAVSNLLGEWQGRNAKLQQQLNGLQKEAAEVKDNIDELGKVLITYALEDDDRGQENTNKKIAQLRHKHADLISRITTYRAAMTSTAISKESVYSVIELARKEKDVMRKATAAAYSKIEALNRDIEAIHVEIKNINLDMFNYDDTILEKLLSPIAGYIDPSVEPGAAAGYMGRYLSTTSTLQDFLNPGVQKAGEEIVTPQIHTWEYNR